MSIDVIESSNADTGEGVEVKLLIGCAVGSADGILRIVIVRGSAVGADPLDDIEAGEAGADIVDQLLID